MPVECIILPIYIDIRSLFLAGLKGYGEGMVTKLKEEIERYNEEAGDTCVKFKEVTEDEYVVAMCTPSMKRVHQDWEHTAEMIFLDSSGNMDRHGIRVFLLLTYSPVGGLAVGVIFSTSESQDMIEEGLKLYQTLLPEKAFGGRGELGPKLFMTDDGTASRNALKKLYPRAHIYLCIFHVLQAVWRYLVDAKHGINADDRQAIYYTVKEMLWAEEEQSLEDNYQKLMAHLNTQKYSTALSYFKDLYDKNKLGALFQRFKHPQRVLLGALQQHL